MVASAEVCGLWSDGQADWIISKRQRVGYWSVCVDSMSIGMPKNAKCEAETRTLQGGQQGEAVSSAGERRGSGKKGKKQYSRKKVL